MRLCMFHPVEEPMERGWVGRIEDDRVVHLAAQSLQSFFTGGGSAREHAVYPLDGVRLLAPVLHPPSIRVFEDEQTFEFANPAAVVGPERAVLPTGEPGDTLSRGSLRLFPRLAAVVGPGAELAGFTICADWRDGHARPPKDRDFALGLGPVVSTPDELPLERGEMLVSVDGEERLRAAGPDFDWTAARDLAAEGTALYAGDLLLGPAPALVDGFGPSSTVAVQLEGIGTLLQTVAARG